MANTKITTNVIADGAITSAKLDTNITISGDITGTLATAAQPNITSVGTLTGLTTSGDINFGDNDKAIFGAGSDLQIYHDGSNSYINDVGTGSLYIKATNLSLSDAAGEQFLNAYSNGGVVLYHDNAQKFETTSTGIDVTGTAVTDGLTATGVIVTEGDAAVNDAQIGRLNFTNTNSNASSNPIRASILAGRQNSAWGGYLSLYTSTGTDAASEKVRITETGNVLVGTTTFNNLSTESGVLASNNVVMARGGLNDHQDACGVLQYSSDATWLRAYGDTAGSGYLIFRTGGGAGSSDTERMRITSAGNVKIKTTNDYYANDLVVSCVNNGGMTIVGGTSDLQYLAFADGTSGDQRYRGYIEYGHNTDHMAFATGGTEKMRIHASGAIQSSAGASVSGVISRTTAPTGSQGLNITASVVTGLPVTTPTFADNSSSGASIYLGGNAVDQYGGSVVLKAYGAGSDGNQIIFENRSGTNTFKQTMRIHSDGNVTKPTQCNFLARRSGNQTGYNASGSYGDGIRYNSEIYDIGGDFDVTTGIFTAPVDGTYLIQGSVYSSTAGTNWSQAWLAVNGARAEYTDMTGNDGDLFISTTHIVKLSAGDEVRYHPYYSGSTSVTIIANNNHTWFKGYLLG